ncbi:leucine-rich melanocyte differentiation-associated protein [Ditylenchus destructor]|uniref:Leucine-rich melanocyte differentiation-associated protein n=1 Tax=Ditylenchus destructor TaxID=166010 RepID=A0AAD4R8G1_9BILA|nr:leucine-rich melanocyte differentiation-associated protein [Ditylenchus destructor]
MIQPCCAARRRKYSQAKQSVCALPPARRAVSLVAPPQADDQNSEFVKENVSIGGDFSLVDISNQNLGALPSIISEKSDLIEHLILDGNQLTEDSLEDIPRLEKLKSLSLNANKIKNIGLVLQFLARQCPSLTFLSLIGNPGWPHPVINADFRLYETYALAATRMLRSLRFLDTSAVCGSSPGRAGRVMSQHCNIV